MQSTARGVHGLPLQTAYPTLRLFSRKHEEQRYLAAPDASDWVLRRAELPVDAASRLGRRASGSAAAPVFAAAMPSPSLPLPPEPVPGRRGDTVAGAPTAAAMAARRRAGSRLMNIVSGSSTLDACTHKSAALVTGPVTGLLVVINNVKDNEVCTLVLGAGP